MTELQGNKFEYSKAVQLLNKYVKALNERIEIKCSLKLPISNEAELKDIPAKLANRQIIWNTINELWVEISNYIVEYMADKGITFLSFSDDKFVYQINSQRAKKTIYTRNIESITTKLDEFEEQGILDFDIDFHEI